MPATSPAATTLPSPPLAARPRASFAWLARRRTLPCRAPISARVAPARSRCSCAPTVARRCRGGLNAARKRSRVLDATKGLRRGELTAATHTTHHATTGAARVSGELHTVAGRRLGLGLGSGFGQVQGLGLGVGIRVRVSGWRLKAGQQPREAPPREAEDLLKVRTRAQAVGVAP
eukprot:scaffold107109_cov70-Phaeocystis_antarctica.AAC.1